jgi:type IX secretion system PorP/SprF family membrane protein
MKWILIIFFVCIAFNFNAQHRSDYMQYMFNGLLVNPAYAGSQEALSITALYRKQWVGFDGAPVTSSFSGHTRLKNNKLNLGLIVLNDCFGIYNHNMVSLVYAYRMRLMNGHLSFGLQGGVDNYSADWSKVNTTDKNDPGFMAGTERRTVLNAGFGTYYYAPKFYLGFSMPELFNDNISKYRTAVFTSGVLINAGDNFKIKPAFLLKHIYNSPISTNVSSTFYWKDIIGLGVGYTISTSALALVDLKINNQFRIGYGYEYLLNKLSTYSSGSHEIMLRYLFRYKIEAQSARYF